VTCFVILAGYCACMFPGVALCGLLSWCLLLTVGIAFFFLFPCLPFVLLTLQLRMKTTSSLTTTAMKLRDKDCEWVVDRHAMRKLCFPCVVLSRFCHFGDIIGASHQTLIMCSSQASDGKLLAPAAGMIWVLKRSVNVPITNRS